MQQLKLKRYILNIVELFLNNLINSSYASKYTQVLLQKQSNQDEKINQYDLFLNECKFVEKY